MAAGAAAEHGASTVHYINNADFLVRTEGTLHEWMPTRAAREVTFDRGLTIGQLKQEVKRMFSLPFDVSLIGKSVWNNPEGRWYVHENDNEDQHNSGCFENNCHVLWENGTALKMEQHLGKKHNNELDRENTVTFQPR